MCSTQPAQLYARAPVGAAEGSFDLSPAHNSLPCESSETCSLLISLPEQRGVVGRVHRHWPCPSTLESRPAVVDRLQSPEYCPASALPYFVTTGKPLPLPGSCLCTPLQSERDWIPEHCPRQLGCLVPTSMLATSPCGTIPVLGF